MTHLLALSGSLRAASLNTELLKAALPLAPAGVTVTLYTGLENVPPFNPDHDVDPAPPAVARLRRLITASDGLLFCTPEYAHGVPGTLKNALDWLVASGELSQKPFALWNASPRSHHAQASLQETLTTMDALIVPAACADFPLQGHKLDAHNIAANPVLADAIRSALSAFAA